MNFTYVNHHGRVLKSVPAKGRGKRPAPFVGQRFRVNRRWFQVVAIDEWSEEVVASCFPQKVHGKENMRWS
jgi:hypothetical protein